jgi:hypothetical protein
MIIWVTLSNRFLSLGLHFKNGNILPGAGGSACNPSYSGDRDQEDHGSKTAQANNS